MERKHLNIVEYYTNLKVNFKDCVNEFIFDKEIVDIKYQVSITACGEEQLYCFSAMIIYVDKG